MRSIIDMIIRHYVNESLNRVNSNDVYVTELVSCPMKYYNRLKYPILMIQNEFNEKILLGKIIHNGIEQLLNEILQYENIKVEIPISKEIDGIKIVGRADVVYNDTVIEIKTTRNDNNIPYEHHELQVGIYANFLGLPKAKLVYIIMNKDVKLLEYDVEPVSDDIINNLVNDIKTQNENAIPRYDWECRYCIFRNVCPYYRDQK